MRDIIGCSQFSPAGVKSDLPAQIQGTYLSTARTVSRALYARYVYSLGTTLYCKEKEEKFSAPKLHLQLHPHRM